MRFSKLLLNNMSKITDISKIWFGPLPDSSHLKPFRLYFHQNGCDKNWDLLKIDNRHIIVIIIYNETTEKLLFMKKFRPSVYHNFVGRQFDENQSIALEIFPPSLGETLELFNFMYDDSTRCLCGLVQSQVKMCGYAVELNKIEKIITFKSGVGYASATKTLFYCKVNDKNKITIPEIDENDDFEIVELSLIQADILLKDFRVLNCTPDLLFSILWILNYRIRAPKTIDNNPPVFMNEMVTD